MVIDTFNRSRIRLANPHGADRPFSRLRYAVFADDILGLVVEQQGQRTHIVHQILPNSGRFQE
jgi:hypothetical protein